MQCAAYARAEGSSPLARGLLEEVEANRHPVRIIPARAGFTGSPVVALQPHQDHPRSRGVYLVLRAVWLSVGGSSPLARGLPAPGARCSPPAGIIPARAGFTLRPCSPSVGARDHPRSRGVYCAWCSMLASRGGSSPLARGLHHGLGRVPMEPRIIPARAGFTQRDRMVLVRLRGSSPLARGLHIPGRLLVLRLRIIPARAGFTGDHRLR